MQHSFIVDCYASTASAIQSIEQKDSTDLRELVGGQFINELLTKLLSAILRTELQSYRFHY